jgi:hydrogenase expression/formation protein HypC
MGIVAGDRERALDVPDAPFSDLSIVVRWACGRVSGTSYDGRRRTRFKEHTRMCLAVPGKIVSVGEGDPLARTGRVNFGGVVKVASLAFVPEAGVGDYVIVHAGFALSRVDEKEAQEVFEYLRQIDELGDELGEAGVPSDATEDGAPAATQAGTDKERGA